MYKQIINWLVFGALFDPNGEFFIQAKKGEDMANSTKTITTSEKAQNKYIVEYSIVPSHLPVTLTERILFIGYAIGILSNSESKIYYNSVFLSCTSCTVIDYITCPFQRLKPVYF